MLEKLEKQVEYIKSVANFEPEIGVILGTGLGGLVDEMKITTAISYAEYQISLFLPFMAIRSPHFGELSGRKLVAMQGRFTITKVIARRKLPFRCVL